MMAKNRPSGGMLMQEAMWNIPVQYDWFIVYGWNDDSEWHMQNVVDSQSFEHFSGV